MGLKAPNRPRIAALATEAATSPMGQQGPAMASERPALLAVVAEPTRANELSVREATLMLAQVCTGRSSEGCPGRAPSRVLAFDLAPAAEGAGPPDLCERGGCATWRSATVALHTF